MREIIKKQTNKNLSKYYRQLGEIETNFEKMQKDEHQMVVDILKLRRINENANGEIDKRSESQKRGIIDN